MNALAGRRFERILIIKPSSAGDVLHALPVVRGLRAALPQAHLAWLVGAAFTDLLALEPGLDEVISFDRRYFARVGRRWSPTRDFVRFVGELRRRGFDLVIDLQGLFRSGFLARACRARVRIGFRDARELAWMFYTHPLRTRQDAAHAVDRNLEALDLLGLPRGPVDLRPALSDADRAAAADILRGRGIDPAAPFASIAPATRWETKQWPFERFGQVAEGLRASRGMPTVLVGGAADHLAGELAADAAKGAAVNLCGATNLRQLAAVIERAALVVACDSFPMHLAAAFGRPLVSIFGPTSPRRTGPYGRLDSVLRLDLACSPCFIRQRARCPHAHRCMEELTGDAVLAAAIRNI